MMKGPISNTKFTLIGLILAIGIHVPGAPLVASNLVGYCDTSGKSSQGGTAALDVALDEIKRKLGDEE